MGKDGPEVQMRLNGWLPGAERNGLGLVAEKLWQAFEEARRAGDETRDTVRTVVVGVLWVPDAKTPHPGSESDPEIHLKFEAVEPVLQEDELEQVTKLLTELRARRRGDAPELESPDGEKVLELREPTGGESTSSKPAAKKAAKRGGLKALHAAAVADGDDAAAEALEREQAEVERLDAGPNGTVPDPFTVS